MWPSNPECLWRQHAEAHTREPNKSSGQRLPDRPHIPAPRQRWSLVGVLRKMACSFFSLCSNPFQGPEILPYRHPQSAAEATLPALPSRVEMRNSWWPLSRKIFHRPEDPLYNQPSPKEGIPALLGISQRFFILQVAFANGLTTGKFSPFLLRCRDRRQTPC